MTKQQEIKALDTFIRDLGSDSYLGPWLADRQGDIEQDIKNDHEPSVPLPNAARRQAAVILADARAAADQVRALAEKQADEIVTRAREAGEKERRYTADLIAKHAAEAIARIGGRY